MSFGVPENRAKRALVATKNSGMDDVFAYMEQHENDPDIDKPLPETVQSKKKKKKPRLIPLELQNLFTKLKFIDCKAISTEGIHTMKRIAGITVHYSDVCIDRSHNQRISMARLRWASSA